MALGLVPGMGVMVHSSLSKLGWTDGGPLTVIRALLEVVGEEGTLVMPAESPAIGEPDNTDIFDPATTPTAMGAIPEAFRQYPGTVRSFHPLVSVCANGPMAAEITKDHALPICEGRGTPFEKLYDLDMHTLLLGVSFNRCTSLHYAESLTPNRRTTVSRYPMLKDGNTVWIESPDMASDNSTHFPLVGEQFIAANPIQTGKIGAADAMLFSTRALVDFAEEYFTRELR